MRKLIVALSIVAALGCAACAKTITATDGTATAMTTDEALTQAQGAATALATLAQTSPMDDVTKQQMAGYAAWADFALRAAGIIATASGL